MDSDGAAASNIIVLQDDMDQDDNPGATTTTFHANGDSLDDDNFRQMENLFSSMGTNDKDVLVKELREMVGNSNMNDYTATFLLDMNNWNLQLAVGSYFDLDLFPTPSRTTPSPIAPTNYASPSEPTSNGMFSTAFSCASFPSPIATVCLSPKVPTKVIIGLQNDGNTRWPEGCSLRYVQGDFNLAVSNGPHNGDLTNENNSYWTVSRIPFEGSLEPTTTYIPLEMTLLYPFFMPTNSPNPTGNLTMQWQMVTPDGYRFGKPIDFQIEIKEHQPAEMEQAVVEQFERMST